LLAVPDGSENQSKSVAVSADANRHRAVEILKQWSCREPTIVHGKANEPNRRIVWRSI
jgi:hypothetical protein